MSKDDYKILLRKVRITLARMPWRRILAFCFCLLLSAIFWFIQVYRQNFTETFSIPVSYINVPDSIVFDYDLPPIIEVSIRDNGYNLFKHYFTKRHDTITIDVSDIVKYLPTKILQGVSLYQVIKDNLLSSSELLDYSPNSISFYYTPLLERKVPVIFDGQIFLAPDYLLNGDITVTPDSVTVYGSKEALNSMKYAYTVNDTISDFKSQENLTYALKSVNKLKFVPSEVQVTVPVDKYTQKDIMVPITCGNVPQGMNVRFFPSSVKVSFLVGISKYEKIGVEDFAIEFDYSELKSMKESFVSLRILSSPDYVQNLKMSPSEAEFIFEKE